MKIINAGYEIMPMNEGMFKNIERVARVCYKSEDKICEGSAEKMVNSLTKRKHEAMLEHECIFFEVPEIEDYLNFLDFVNRMKTMGMDCMIRTTYLEDRGVVSGNIRMWRDFIKNAICINNSLNTPCNKLLVNIPQVVADLVAYKNIWPIIFDDMDFDVDTKFDGGIYAPIKKEQLTDAEKYVHYPITVKFIIDAGVGREITRHRIASFAHESTRYCNYSKDGFGAEITVIKPCFFEEGTDAYEAWKTGCEAAEKAYMALLNLGRTPQEARDVLPFSVKGDLVMTAVINEWIHFFNLRALDKTGAAHPQMKEVTVPLFAEISKKYPGFFN